MFYYYDYNYFLQLIIWRFRKWLLSLKRKTIYILTMSITSYKNETIVIDEPSEKLLNLVKRMREHKRARREAMREANPLFTINAN